MSASERVITSDARAARIGGPRESDQWRPLGADVSVLVLDGDFSADDCRRVAEMMQDRSDVALSVARSSDLRVLRFVPWVRRLIVAPNYGAFDLQGIEHASEDLADLTIYAARRPISMQPLERFTHLRKLFIEGPQRDIEAIGTLPEIEDLTLRSITLPDLSLLEGMDRLHSLDLKLGGTNDLRLLPRIGSIRYLELWQIRGLDDLDTLADISTLRHLFLQSIKRVARLPSFANVPSLLRADLVSMKGLTDLRPLAAAPNLEILNLFEFGHAQPTILAPFVGHPSLLAGDWSFGSYRKDRQAQDLVPLPPEPRDYAAKATAGLPDPGLAPWDRPDWAGSWRADR